MTEEDGVQPGEARRPRRKAVAKKRPAKKRAAAKPVALPPRMKSMNDLESILSEAEAFGLPRVGDWQQIQPGTAGEFVRDRTNTRRDDVLPWTDSTKSQTVRALPEPRAYAEAKDLGVDLSGDFAHWVNTSTGDLLIGTPSDPTLYQAEVNELAEAAREHAEAAETMPIELDPAATPLMGLDGAEDSPMVTGRDVPDRLPAASSDDAPSKLSWANLTHPQRIVTVAMIVFAIGLTITLVSLALRSSDETATATGAAGEADGNDDDNASNNDGNEQDSEQGDDDSTVEAEPEAATTFGFGSGDMVYLGAVSATAAEAEVASGELPDVAQDSTAPPALNLYEATFALDGSVVSGAVTVTGEPNEPFRVGVVLYDTWADQRLVIMADTATGVVQDGIAGFEVAPPQRTMGNGFSMDGDYRIRLDWPYETSWSGVAALDDETSADMNVFAVPFEIDLEAIEIPAEWVSAGDGTAGFLAILDQPTTDDDTAFLRTEVDMGRIDITPFATTPYLSLAGQYVDVEEARQIGLERNPEVPAGFADCFVEDVTLAQEVQSSLRPVAQEQLAAPCFLRAQFDKTQAAAAFALWVLDDEAAEAAFDCVSQAMAPLMQNFGDVALFAFGDINEWPAEWVSAYATALDECLPLEEFYLNQFSQFDYINPDCPAIMAKDVTTDWDFGGFIEIGILDPDEAKRLEGLTIFQADVDRRHLENECFAPAAEE